MRSPAPALHRAETDALRDALTSDTGYVIVLEGEVGSGKSFLLDETIAAARGAGHVVLHARGRRGEPSAPPFAGLRTLLEPVRSYLDRVQPHPRASLERVLDDSDAEVPQVNIVAVGTLAVLEALAGEHRVLVAVDDLDALDSATREVLELVRRRLTPGSVLVIVTQRQGSASTVPGAAVVRIASLTTDAAEQLLDSLPIAVHPAVRTRVLEEGRGNPLALIELARSVAELGPLRGLLELHLRVTDRAAERFDELQLLKPAERRALVLLALALEGTTRAELVAAAEDLGLGPGTFDRLEQRGLVDGAVGARPRLTHPLMRPAMLASATVDEQAQSHAVLSRHLVDRLHGLIHRAAAAPETVTSRSMEDAAVAAMNRGEHNTAALGFRSAVSLASREPDAAHLLLLAAEMARHAGRSAEATELLERADALPMLPPDVARSLIVHVRLRRMVGPATHSNLELVQRAASLSREGETLLLRARALGVVATCIWLAGSPEPDCDAVLAALPATAQGRTWEEQVAAAIVRPDAIGPSFRDELARQLLSFVRGAPVLDAVLLTYARAAESIGALDLAEQAWTLQMDDHRLNEAPADAIVEQLARGRVRLAMGDPLAALADGEEARRLALAADLPRLVVAANAVIAVADGLRGRAVPDAASDAFGAAARDAVLPSADALTAWAQGLEALLAGDHQRALDRLGIAARHPATAPWVVADLVECARALDRVPDVVDRLESVDAFARSTGSAWARSVALRARAVAGLDEDPTTDLEAALAAAVRSGSPLHVAATRLDLGRVVQRQGDLVAAREHLETAARTFSALGAYALADRADIAARSSGGRAAPSSRHAPPELSGRDLEVVRLAAGGLTNKAIAERLHVSPRTVAAHLYRVFPRLGIARRSQLASVLGDLAVPSTAGS